MIKPRPNTPLNGEQLGHMFYGTPRAKVAATFFQCTMDAVQNGNNFLGHFMDDERLTEFLNCPFIKNKDGARELWKLITVPHSGGRILRVGRMMDDFLDYCAGITQQKPVTIIR